MTKTKKTRKKSKTSVFDVITNRILEALKTGTIPWEKKWLGTAGIPPQNYKSKHHYRGINYLLASMTPHTTPFFMTWKQIKEMNGSLKEGALRIPIVFWNVFWVNADKKVVKDPQPGDIVEKRFSTRYYTVFNIEDIDGIEFDIPKPERENDPIEIAQQLVDGYPKGPKVMTGKPCYQVEIDVVRRPELDQFETSEFYHKTLFHELVHSTGHPHRLNRPGVAEIDLADCPKYAFEELIAEIGACFAMSHCGIENPGTIEQANSYIAGWIEALEHDPKYIIRAATAAKKAIEHMIG